jgi:hypothetical protein
MAGKSTAAATDPTPTATPSGEPVAPTAEPVEQNITAQIEELNKRLSEYETVRTQLESRAKEAEAKALRNEAMYKGLQSQTTKTLQQAAEERKRLDQLERNNGEIADIKELLSGIANRVLDENEQKELQFRQRELRLKRAEEALVAPQTQPVQNAASPSYQNPEDVKAQFLEFYFPGVEVDSNDPGIDWGDGAASPQDAFRRFTVSVMNLKNQKEQSKTQDAMAAIKAETDAALTAFKAQQDQLFQQSREEVEKAKETAKEEARKDSEKKLRALGADVSGTPLPDSQGEGSSLMQMMTDQLDDSLLRTPKGREEFNRRMENIRAKVRGR